MTNRPEWKIVAVTLTDGDRGWLRPFGECQFELVESAEDAQQYNGIDAAKRAGDEAVKFTFGSAEVAKIDVYEAP